MLDLGEVNLAFFFQTVNSVSFDKRLIHAQNGGSTGKL
jgi:hypothetical protein